MPAKGILFSNFTTQKLPLPALWLPKVVTLQLYFLLACLLFIFISRQWHCSKGEIVCENGDI